MTPVKMFQSCEAPAKKPLFPFLFVDLLSLCHMTWLGLLVNRVYLPSRYLNKSYDTVDHFRDCWFGHHYFNIFPYLFF